VHNRNVLTADDLQHAMETGRPLMLGADVPDPGRADGAERRRVLASSLRKALIDPRGDVDPRGLTLTGAIVEGDLDLSFVSIPYPLTLSRCLVIGSVTLVGAHAATVRFSGSRIESSSGYCIEADGLRVDNNITLDDGFTTRNGSIRMKNAQIGGELTMSGAILGAAETDEYALMAEAVHVAGSADLSDGFTVTTGAVRLVGANVGGELNMGAAVLEGADADGWALVADGIRTGLSLVLSKGFTATAGGVRLIGGSIGGQLNMRGAKLIGVGSENRALMADSIQVANGAYLDRGFTVTRGAIRLPGARIGGQFNMRGARLQGADDDGCALSADGIQVGSAANLGEGFTVTEGGIRLLGARIGGGLDMRGANLAGADNNGCSVYAERLQAGAAFLDQGVNVAGTVRLTNARVGVLWVSGKEHELPTLGDATGWVLGDAHGAIRADRKAAARWLDEQGSGQPWRELAELYDRNGQPADARWLRYQSAVRSTRHSKPWSKFARSLYRITTGHGYYPLLAFAWILVAVSISWGLAFAYKDTFTTPVTPAISADIQERRPGGLLPGEPLPGRAFAEWCTPEWDVPCFEPLAYAMSSVLPVTLGEQPWSPPQGGAWLLFAALRLFAWGFTAILLAGVTGLLRKQT
jgi:hypothetical protein